MVLTNEQLEEEISWIKKNIKSYVEHNSTAPGTDKRLTILETDVKNRVTFKQFYWVIGIMMTILMATIGYLIDQIHDVQNNQYEVAREVSEISGTLKSIDFINLN